MSGMILGSMIEADARMRRFEQQVRLQRRLARDRAEWEKFTREFGDGDDGLMPSHLMRNQTTPPSGGATQATKK